ncbi:MAG: flagellar hook-basal body complex protein FliE [Thermodesulfobacterium geofontis]|uniref:Flagellar hook-basal body complex protein FliE n=1 Tax=Thermodesulfobacterium geofontis TaxID=1295609 RepID=A0A2N7PPN0_9BACT|nr:MAG: flagellar hook-basal body complex protein FliE [Thermodesulfobacterium geofontis]PMP97353.1 MAG: flagellar hook-basal body complex protein FliE [Thermodesulfobacterium geofontis]
MKINPGSSIQIKNFEYLQNGALKNKLDFKNFLLEKIKEIDHSQKEAQKMLEALAKGEDIDFSEVALAISKADLNFKLLLRIRNKVLEAYQEIMRMQI